MTIPTNLRVPFMFVEFDPSKAFQGPAILEYKALLTGQKMAAGSKAELQIDRITSFDQASEYYGNGSMLARMAEKWFLNNKFTSVYACAIDDAIGTKSEGSIEITGTATASGTLSFTIDGKLVPVSVAVDDAFGALQDALEDAINANVSLPVIASPPASPLPIIAKNSGTLGNEIDIQINYNEGEVTPAGLTVAIVAMTGGATDPDISEIITILGDEWYNIFVCPWADATNLIALEIELADRFGYLRMIDGVAFISKRGTLGELETFGNGRNSPHVSCPNSHKIPEAPEEYAAAIAGQVAAEGSIDPARPFQTLGLVGIHPPKIVDRFTTVENNSLLFDGISTNYVDSAGVVRIQRLITMYQKNIQDAPDIAYLDVNTMLTLMYLRFDFRNYILTKYPRAKLADDGVLTAPNQQIMTPKIGKAEAIAKFKQWEYQGLVENLSQFKNDLICIRNNQDPNRLDWTLSPDLMNQFRVGAAIIQFLLGSSVV